MSTIKELQASARSMRREGMTFEQIIIRLQTPLPISLVQQWCADISVADRHRDQAYRQRQTQRVIEKNLIDRLSQIESDNRAPLFDSESTAIELNDRVTCRQLIGLLYLTSPYPPLFDNNIAFSSFEVQTLKLFLQLFRRSYEIDERKFRVMLHVTTKTDVDAARQHWSEAAAIPSAQFFSPTIASVLVAKLNPLRMPFGLCQIIYQDSHITQEIIRTACSLLGSLLDEEVDAIAWARRAA